MFLIKIQERAIHKVVRFERITIAQLIGAVADFLKRSGTNEKVSNERFPDDPILNSS